VRFGGLIDDTGLEDTGLDGATIVGVVDVGVGDDPPGAVTAPGLNGPAPANPNCDAATLAEAARARGLMGMIVAYTCVGGYAAARATVSEAAITIGFERRGTGWMVVEEGLGNGLPTSNAVPSEVSAALSSNLAKAPRTDQTGF